MNIYEKHLKWPESVLDRSYEIQNLYSVLAVFIVE